MRSLPEKVKRGLGRLFGREAGGVDHSPSPEAPPELRARAAEHIREYAEGNEALFERASRFEEKAERLQESDGTTSESAIKRAERARAEIQAGLSALRESFAASDGDEGKLAFDAEISAAYPAFDTPEEG